MKLAPQEVHTYFVTTVTAGRRRIIQVESAANLMLDVFLSYRKQKRFELRAFVIMPDHLHLLLTPATDVSLEKSMQLIKGGFSFRFKNKRDVWERSFNEVQICCLKKFEACKHYVEQNPVRGRLSVTAEGYPFSSAFLRYMVDDPVPEQFMRAGGEARG